MPPLEQGVSCDLSALIRLDRFTSFAADFPKFKTQEIDAGLKIGYAVLTADIDGDKKPDIVVVDQHKVVWYENPDLEEAHHPRRQDEAGQRLRRGPGHRRRRAAGNRPRRGLEAVRHRQRRAALVAEARQVARRRVDDARAPVRRADGPPRAGLRHRRRRQAGDRPRPAAGQGATAKGNWTDGRPVRVIALKMPAKDPEKKENWKPEVLSEELHVCHNFWPWYPSIEGRPTAVKPLHVDGRRTTCP